MVQELIKQGEDLGRLLSACRIFPPDFLDVVSNAEESGRISEVMDQQAGHYQEEASRRMTVLVRVAGFGVWAFVAVLLVIAIFRIYVVAYRADRPGASGDVTNRIRLSGRNCPLSRMRLNQRRSSRNDPCTTLPCTSVRRKSRPL